MLTFGTLDLLFLGCGWPIKGAQKGEKMNKNNTLLWLPKKKKKKKEKELHKNKTNIYFFNYIYILYFLDTSLVSRKQSI